MLTIFDLVDVSENINLIEIIDFAIIFFSDLIITLKFKSLLNKLSLQIIILKLNWQVSDITDSIFLETLKVR